MKAKMVLATSFVALAACGGSPAPTAATPTADSVHGGAPDLAGHWRSACVKTNATQSVTLDFQLTRQDWTLDYVTYADTTCSAPFVTAHIEGPYEIGAKSAVVPGAWDGHFGFRTKRLIPGSDAAVAFLSSAAGCNRGGFAVGKPTDVLATGCAGLGQLPGSSCEADFDLVSVTSDGLRFGDRPKDNDMCTEPKRPRALGPLVSARVR